MVQIRTRRTRGKKVAKRRVPTQEIPWRVSCGIVLHLRERVDEKVVTEIEDELRRQNEKRGARLWTTSEIKGPERNARIEKPSLFSTDQGTIARRMRKVKIG